MTKTTTTTTTRYVTMLVALYGLVLLCFVASAAAGQSAGVGSMEMFPRQAARPGEVLLANLQVRPLQLLS